jgi:DNA-binding protein HU-beta
MNKQGLVNQIANEANMSKVTAGRSIESAIAAITNALKRGDHVTLSGFGTFITYKRQPRNGRNPLTGAPIKIAGRRVAKFAPGVD